MARKAVVDAFLDRLGPVVGAPDDPRRYWQPMVGDPVPVFGPNETGDADPGGGMFLMTEFVAASEEMASIGSPGNNRWTETGVVRILINTERNSGADLALTWADEIAALFRGQRLANEVQCWAVNSPQFDARNDESGYFRCSVAVGYEADIFA